MSRRAFTIAEVLIALALIAAVGAAAMTLLWGVADHRERIGSTAMASRGCGDLLERIESDLLGAVAGDARVGAGVRGDATSLTILCRGVTGLASISAVSGDLVGASYTLAGDRVEMRRWVVGGAAGGASEPSVPLAEGVGALRLRYFDGSTWLDSFDSAQVGKLPVAIEASIWLGPRPEAGAGDEAPMSPAPPDDSLAAESSEFSEDLPPLDEGGGLVAASLEEELGPPTRQRIMIVPDGPVAAWRDSR